MIIAIETSCDETAISALNPSDMKVLGHVVHSQAQLHAEFGGVFPNLAKREHGKNLIPVLQGVLHQALGFDMSQIHADMPHAHQNIDEDTIKTVTDLLSKEGDLAPITTAYFNSLSSEQFSRIKTEIEAIAVTYGPGLEPALWVGISFAKAVAVMLDKPLLPINHMEGHIASVISHATSHQSVSFPAIALLISGGHTELVQVDSWHQYVILGHTVDDAVGEAYDKVARILSLPYPGGPEISKLAHAYAADHADMIAEKISKQSAYNQHDDASMFKLPRPMLYSKDLNFSFSGLKTAVLYGVKDRLRMEHADRPNAETLSDEEKRTLAYEFECAVVDVLVAKTKKAIEQIGAQSLIIGGGVIANTVIRQAFVQLTQKLGIDLYLPDASLATDNATMIGIVASLQYQNGYQGMQPTSQEFSELKAEGNLSL